MIENKKLIVLSTFGHCGIDWLHSLLDGHNQILIIPSLSFYRSLEIFEKKFKINYKDKKKFVEKFINYILKRGHSRTKRYQVLKPNQKKKIFKKYVLEYLKKKKDFSINKDLFYALHYSFAKINNFDLKKKKIIIAHEHAPWNCHKYENYFNCKYIFIVRDPRASIAGSIKAHSWYNQNLTSYEADMIFNFFMTAHAFYRKKKKKLYVIKNEKLNLNLKKEMKLLSSWAGVSFNKSFLKPTLLGKSWGGETSYISKGDLKNKLPKNYYNAEKVRDRWLKVLNDDQIMQIEIILKNIFKDFNYEEQFNYSYSDKIKIYLRFLFNMDFAGDFQTLNILKHTKIFLKRFLLINFNKSFRKYFLI